MRSIVTFSPFQELHRFADLMDTMWGADQRPDSFVTGLAVPMDIWEQDGKIYLKAALPGVDPNKVELTLDGDVLTLSGELSDEHEYQGPNRKLYHREVRYGQFARSITLPDDADQQHIDAEFKNGLLTVCVPRKKPAATTPRKKLPIRTAEPNKAIAGKTPQAAARAANKS